MWSRTRWTEDWYLAARWAWLLVAVCIVVTSAIARFGTGVILGCVLVAYTTFLLRRTLARRREASE
jgi:hypothetical protein